MANPEKHDGTRAARMPFRSTVLISQGQDSWSGEALDISATGMRVTRPADWLGAQGEVFVLDLLIGESLNIHLEAELARISESELGFAFWRIPEDREIPLWSLLGSYADSNERYDQYADLE